MPAHVANDNLEVLCYAHAQCVPGAKNSAGAQGHFRALDRLSMYKLILEALAAPLPPHIRWQLDNAGVQA